ncbi:FAD-dependent monooxygenase [Streptomyces spiroverticillatus]|uniref:FAD-dependent monooxygenase n=1 Tax=Streptomyces finlayi TaxID=67296 RepID=A0A918X824_9ACTN|nr:NAD(P)/FAD-dependent oxidoreductase [Streptomyces finlayi]GHA44234.1 FAD-dependent monooxygenase [Streptomyces spiroverticillatus]GHD17711.1 FAD-dependent monooxygenase [Streptomyces finlayi]
MKSIKVIIVGGGIGGLALAVALRERGISSEVFERAGDFGNTGSGIELTPNGVKSVDCISPRLGEEVRASGWSSERHCQDMPIMSWDGKLLKSREVANFPAKWGAPMIGIRRADLHRILAEAVQRPGRAEVTVHHRAKVCEAYNTGDTATVLLSDGRKATGDLVVGADGVRSTLRTLVAGDVQPRYLGFTSIRGISKRPAQHGDGFVFVGPGGHFFAEAFSDTRLFWTATVNAPEHSWPRKPMEQARADLLRLWGDWSPPLAETVESCAVEDMVVTDVHDCPPLKRWHTGRLVLLGDAAHPIGPVLGQGANMALEDVASLASLLAEHHVPAALRQYGRVRSQRANKIVQHSRLIARLGHTTNPLVGRVRDALIKSMKRREDTYRDKELFNYNP